MREALLAALGAAALAGCSLAPRYQRPEAPVAERAGAPAASQGAGGQTEAAAGGSAADALGWRDVFRDARLQALVELALAQNRDLRTSALNVELTRAQYRIQRAAYLPTLSGVGSFTRQHVPTALSATGNPATVDTFQVGASAGFELDLFGRVRSLSEAALEQYLATEEARRSAQIALVAAVVQQELAVRALDEQVALARQTLQTVDATLQLTQRTYQAGRSSELDLRIAETQVETARFNLSVAQEQRARAGNALVLLVGAPLPATLPPPAPPGEAPVVAELPAGVPSDVLLRRPDVLAAEHALVSANAAIGAARAAFFPSITLTAGAGTASSSLSGLFGAGTGYWSFAPRVDVPIFRGGALRASLDVAEVRKSIQIAQYERAIQGAFREVSDALATRAAVGEQLRAEQARVAAEQRRYELSELRYRKGVDSYLNVLTAQRDLFAAQQQLIQTRLLAVTNLVDLYRALGGGWSERTVAAK